MEVNEIVYSLLNDHPASAVCELFIREHTSWLTTTPTLLEAKAILTKVYNVDTNLASQQLSQFSAVPIEKGSNGGIAPLKEFANSVFSEVASVLKYLT